MNYTREMAICQIQSGTILVLSSRKSTPFAYFTSINAALTYFYKAFTDIFCHNVINYF